MGNSPSKPLANTPPFGLYIHVPFCAVRCGYCDFNTYTATELGEGASQAEYAATAAKEMELAYQYLKNTRQKHAKIKTIFFGGGTPTLLPVTDLIMLVEHARSLWGLDPDVEITTEANPDSVTKDHLEQLKVAGFNRISFGMQSAIPHVLATLDRTHNPDNVARAVQWAKAAGLDVSVDLIYGTPGESIADWRTSLAAALAMKPDHISAYALTIEPGTKMGAQVKRGLLPEPDPDDEATKYEIAEEVISAAGYHWYEISNWSTTLEQRCLHNINYWRSADWWGIGPGAHSHIDGLRFYNRKHPRPYAQAINSGQLPWQEEELLSQEARFEEEVMLQLRLADGWAFPKDVKKVIDQFADDGLIEPEPLKQGIARLTLRGRLLADLITTEIILAR